MLWFRHDTSSRSDEKLVQLQMDHGMTGIGVYWCIIEMLYEQMGSMRLQCERIAFELRTQCDVVADVLQKYDLFQIDGEIVTSQRVTETMNENFVKSKGARKAALTRWKNANAKQTQSESNADAMHKRREEKKVKEKKEEEVPEVSISSNAEIPSGDVNRPARTKREAKKVWKAPDLDEVIAYFRAEGYTDAAANKFFRYYSQGEPPWHDSRGNPVKGWKQKAQSVWFKPENETKAKEIQATSGTRSEYVMGQRFNPRTGEPMKTT